MTTPHALRAFWSLVVKDLVGEFRGRRVWPAMLLLGLVLVLLLVAERMVGLRRISEI